MLMGWFVMLSLVAGGVRCMMDDHLPHVFCGRRLANAHAFFCSAEAMAEREAAARNLLGNSIEEPTPSVPDKRARTGPSRVKRYIGIVDECCFKPCYIRELVEYC